MKMKPSFTLCATSLFLLLYLFRGYAHGQDPSTSLSDTSAAVNALSPDTTSSSFSNSDYPDAPQVDKPSHNLAVNAAQGEGQQTKRIFGIIPNFRAVSANMHLPPQTLGDKFFTATHDSFDYSSVFLPAVIAGYSQATNSTPEFHQGAAGYGRYFWHTAVDQTSENYFVEFIVPVITREDTRYYTLGSGGFLKRTGYALSRAVVTRNDAGHDTFNISEVVGAGASAGVSNFYYPQSQRTLGDTVDKWALNVGVDAATFVFHEFWPDINRAIFHSKTPTD